MTGTDIAMRQERRPRPGLRKRIWIDLRQRIANSEFALSALSAMFVAYLRLVRWTNRHVGFEEARVQRAVSDNTPSIFTCWHGQHFLMPVYVPRDRKYAAMVSRSRDAELNARVIERLGVETVRASGGRQPRQSARKGAVSGIIALRNHLKAGRGVFMMADIPHGTPREVGKGIISVAKLSGAPILPIVCMTSRRHVFERAWDKAELNLPFGRVTVQLGDPIHVPADADDEAAEACRLQLQDALDGLVAKAGSVLGSRP